MFQVFTSIATCGLRAREDKNKTAKCDCAPPRPPRFCAPGRRAISRPGRLLPFPPRSVVVSAPPLLLGRGRGARRGLGQPAPRVLSYPPAPRASLITMGAPVVACVSFVPVRMGCIYLSSPRLRARPLYRWARCTAARPTHACPSPNQQQPNFSQGPLCARSVCVFH